MESGEEKGRREHSTEGAAASQGALFCWVFQETCRMPARIVHQKGGTLHIYPLALSSLIGGRSRGVSSPALLGSAHVKIQGRPLVSESPGLEWGGVSHMCLREALPAEDPVSKRPTSAAENRR